MSSKRQHLQCIRGHYRYRRRYPKSVASVAGSEFFIRHLNTVDLDEAVRKRPLVEAAYWAEVDRLKRLTDAQPRPLTENEALALAATWFAESNRELDARHRDEPTPPAIRQDVIGDAEYVVGMASDALADSSLDAITPLAERLLERRGMRAEPESAGYRTLLQLLWRGMKELNQVDLAPVPRFVPCSGSEACERLRSDRLAKCSISEENSHCLHAPSSAPPPGVQV